MYMMSGEWKIVPMHAVADANSEVLQTNSETPAY